MVLSSVFLLGSASSCCSFSGDPRPIVYRYKCLLCLSIFFFWGKRARRSIILYIIIDWSSRFGI